MVSKWRSGFDVVQKSKSLLETSPVLARTIVNGQVDSREEAGKSTVACSGSNFEHVYDVPLRRSTTSWVAFSYSKLDRRQSCMPWISHNSRTGAARGSISIWAGVVDIRI